MGATYLRETRILLAAVLAGAALLAVPGAANAATVSDYHPTPQAQTFSGGAGGWAGSQVYSGVCTGPLVGVACPSAITTHEPAGGTSADGHLRAGLNGLTASLLGDATAVWESPTFTYNGAGGQSPDSVVFTHSRRADVAELLALTGNSVDYTVQLVDLSDATGSRTLVDQAPVPAGLGWAAMPAIHPGASSLTLGHSYRIRIETRYQTVAGVIPDATVDYDDVILRARRDDGGSGGGGAGPGVGGSIVGGSAVLKGDKLFVKVGCKKRSRPACKFKVTALLKRKGPKATNATKVKVKAGKRKRVRMQVKPNYLEQLKTRKKVLIRLRTKVAGQRSTTKFKRLKLRRA